MWLASFFENDSVNCPLAAWHIEPDRDRNGDVTAWERGPSTPSGHGALATSSCPSEPFSLDFRWHQSVGVRAGGHLRTPAAPASFLGGALGGAKASTQGVHHDIEPNC